MKIFKIIESPPKVFKLGRAILKKFGIGIDNLSKSAHPQEDFLSVSKKYPIFAVADGVTLELDKHGNYPQKSGAGEVARIFCREVVKIAEKSYDDFMDSDIKKIFARANSVVDRYNRSLGRFKACLNYWDIDLFAAAAAFAVVKNGLVYWASICDASVVHFKKDGQLSFRSPDCWAITRGEKSKNWLAMSEEDRKKTGRCVYRNGIGRDGSLVGYGVVTGEKSAERYLSTGKFSVNEGDVVMLMSDGFENYLKVKEFVRLFMTWPKGIRSRLKQITRSKSIDNPSDFGRERTLIAIKF